MKDDIEEGGLVPFSEFISKRSRIVLKSNLSMDSHFFSFDDLASAQSNNFRTVLVMKQIVSEPAGVRPSSRCFLLKDNPKGQRGQGLPSPLSGHSNRERKKRAW